MRKNLWDAIAVDECDRQTQTLPKPSSLTDKTPLKTQAIAVDECDQLGR